MEFKEWGDELNRCAVDPNSQYRGMCRSIQTRPQGNLEDGGVSVKAHCNVCNREWLLVYPKDWRDILAACGPHYPTIPKVTELEKSAA